YLKKGLGLISHRGPDQSGTFCDGHMTLGHRRLSIIDLSERGRQPMFNETGDVCVIFNGEIYNYRELRSGLITKGHRFSSETDTEVLVHGYEEYGAGIVSYLNGCFSFAIYDQTNRKVILARDRLGIKPLYYRLNAGMLSFSSEMKALLADDGFSPSVHHEAFRHFFCLGYTPFSQTLIDGILKLPAGYCLSYSLSTKKAELERYFSLPTSIEKRTFASAKEELLKLLEDSVAKRLVADRPVGIYLSGGIDSGGILGMASRLREKGIFSGPIRTYSAGFSHADNESLLAEEVAAHFEADHATFSMDTSLVNTLPSAVWHADEPLGDPALLPVKFLSGKAAGKVAVVLTGDGADELFAGYEQYAFLPMLHRLSFFPSPVRNAAGRLLSAVPSPLLTPFFKYAAGLGCEGKNRVASILSSLPDKTSSYLFFSSLVSDGEAENILTPHLAGRHDLPGKIAPYFSRKEPYLHQLQRLECETLLPEGYLLKTDKMTMAHGIEARVPYLDHRIAELAFRMPAHYKLAGRKEKYVLREALRPYVPPATAKRKKQRFYVPMDDWMQKDLQPYLSDPAHFTSGYISHKAITHMLERYANAPLFYSRQLWNVLTFELWHSIFIEKKDYKNISLL
ncbi:TPA: asparagine synthase (glutamine-hydrolyzing), partial [Candidatus Woesearchaeota archaeon]|nr:asparagine synthase (glutamine-hydrolyzing) [Candidatus Woesearchaeota archaeon]